MQINGIALGVRGFLVTGAATKQTICNRSLDSHKKRQPHAQISEAVRGVCQAKHPLLQSEGKSSPPKQGAADEPASIGSVGACKPEACCQSRPRCNA